MAWGVEMPSPFPGMDPYLEDPDLWPDVHLTLLVAFRASLNATLPLDFSARIVDCGPYPEKRRRLHVHNSFSEHACTVIHLMAPPEKEPGTRRDLYLSERDAALTESRDWVEIDLLRGGLREPQPVAAYRITTWTVPSPDAPLVRPFEVQEPLPRIPVPLRPANGLVYLDLKSCLDRAFAEARYETTLDYMKPPLLPLAKPDADWAADLLASRTHQGASS